MKVGQPCLEGRCFPPVTSLSHWAGQCPFLCTKINSNPAFGGVVPHPLPRRGIPSWRLDSAPYLSPYRGGLIRTPPKQANIRPTYYLGHATKWVAGCVWLPMWGACHWHPAQPCSATWLVSHDHHVPQGTVNSTPARLLPK